MKRDIILFSGQFADLGFEEFADELDLIADLQDEQRAGFVDKRLGIFTGVCAFLRNTELDTARERRNQDARLCL